MRTFNDIQKTILDAKDASAELNALQITTNSEQELNDINSTSKVSLWRLIVWIIAFVLYIQEQILTELANQTRPQNIPNFQSKVFDFHDGLEHKFINGRFQYDYTGVDNPDALKIIKKAAVFENDNEQIVVKFALENNVLATDEQIGRIRAYLKDEKPPGTSLLLVNKLPDQLKNTLTVYVDIQVIDILTGRLLNSTEEIYPVKLAIKNYLLKLEFNGAFVINRYIREIENQNGIELANINLIQSKYDLYPFEDFVVFKEPQSGHFQLDDENLTINYLDYALVNS